MEEQHEIRRNAHPFAVLALILLSVTAGIQLAADTASLTSLLSRYQAEPNDALLCEQIGVAYTQIGDFKQAIAFFRKAVQLNPERIPARKNLATVLWFSGQKMESEDIFSKLEKRIPDDPVPQLYLGLGAYEHKDFEMAASHFERAGSLAAQNPETLPILVETYLSTGRVGRAREAINRELEQQPGSAKLLLELGLSDALEGDFQRGRQAFLAASAADSHWSLPLIALGITDLQTGSAASAAEYFRKAKLIAPRDYRCYYLRALALKRSAANEAAATRAEELSELQRAAALDPVQGNTWVALGETEIALGHDREGEADLRRALRLAPDDPGALYKLALLCRREGKTQESERLLSAFRESKRKTQTSETELMSLLRTVNSKQ